MDIISELSDDLLLRILSSVPTKDVVATRLLSKRWRFLWMSVPQLEYDDIFHIGDYKIFSQFVYESLLSNKTHVLEKLYLNVGPECPVRDIALWIDIAVSHRVRELEIHIHSSNGRSVKVSLPRSLYTSETLETLKLNDYVLLDVPCPVCLPSLKILRLKHVDYADYTSLQSLLSGCPNLQGLHLERHSGDETKDTIVVVPSLKSLTIFDVNSGTCGRYVTDVPSLKYLNITENVFYNIRQIENMPELVEAHVDITQEVNQEFLKALTSVHRLSLCLSLSKVIEPASMIFDKLVHLELCTCAIDWWCLLTHMLHVSPNLRVLKLTNKCDCDHSAKEIRIGWKWTSSVPECLLFSLEAFVWSGYEGWKGNREMATYVLKNAACLKTATFSPESTDVEDKYQMLKELASVATASTSQLLFD